MKYTITGGAGNISKPLAEKLLASGHQVTVIGRNAANLKPLIDKGAKAAIGSVEDVAFLADAFAGADAVYTMVPPNEEVTDWKEWIGSIGKKYAAAIRANKIGHVVNLSSIGAHTPDGCGPVSGLFRSEAAMNELADIPILHLRPGYFYNNLFSNLPLVKNMNIMGSNFGGAGYKHIMSAPSDIADAAFEALTSLNFIGHSVRYLASDVRSTDEVASALGTAVGKPALPWIVFPDDQAFAGMRQAGLSEEVAKNYVEMGQALRSGLMTEDYWKHRPEAFGKTRLEDFAKVFAAVYNR